MVSLVILCSNFCQFGGKVASWISVNSTALLGVTLEDCSEGTDGCPLGVVAAMDTDLCEDFFLER